MSVLDFMKKSLRRATGKKASRTGLRRVGTSKSHDTCDLCGKTGLKETVVMEGADGARVHYGSECASDHSEYSEKKWPAFFSSKEEAEKAAPRFEPGVKFSEDQTGGHGNGWLYQTRLWSGVMQWEDIRYTDSNGKIWDSNEIRYGRRDHL